MVLGIVCYLYFPKNINWGLLILIVLALFYLVIALVQKGKARAELGILGILFLFIFGYFNAFRANTLAENNFAHCTNFDFYKVTINNLVEEKPKSWKATASVDAVYLQDKIIGTTGLILLYFEKGSLKRPNYGDQFLIHGQPNTVEGPKNPYEFDYKNYLSKVGIYHQQYLRDTSFIKLGRSTPNQLLATAYKVNNFCDSIFTKYITEKNELGVANAMILGLRDDIDNDLIQAYSAAGAIHVLSVSGLHVGVIYIILVWCFGFLKKKGSYGKWFFLFLILGILWFYAMVSGLSSPVLRSTFMFSLILLAETLSRQQNAYNTVAISAFCLLVYDPNLITNVGFLLSFFAVFGMIQIQPLLNPLIIIDKRKNWIYWLIDRLWKVTTVAVAAQIATFPLTIYLFHQFPNYFLLANPIVILLSSVVLIGGLVFLVLVVVLSWFNVLFLNKWMAIVLEIFIRWLNNSVLYTERMPGAISNYLHASFVEMLIMYALIICILTLIQTRKYNWVKLTIYLTAFLLGIIVVDYYKSINQNVICIHAVPKASAISIIEGKTVSLFASNEFLNNRKNINFRCNNFWSFKGINLVKKIVLPESNSTFLWKGNKYLILNAKLTILNEIQSAEYLIVSNNKLQYIKDIKGKVKFKYLILDGNFSRFYANRFQVEAAKDGVLAYSLLQSGALVL